MRTDPNARLDRARELLTERNSISLEDRPLLIEQYRIYLDLTDRLAARRSGTNSFFLAVNAGAITAFGIFWQQPPENLSPGWLLVPAAALILLCGTWFLLVAHYRSISAAKWAVVAALEDHLPAQPFSRAEWQGALQGSTNRRWWRRVTKLEQTVPLIFIALYVAGIIIAFVAS